MPTTTPPITPTHAPVDPGDTSSSCASGSNSIADAPVVSPASGQRLSAHSSVAFTPSQDPVLTQRVASLQSELTQLHQQLHEARQTVRDLDRKRKIDALLAESDAVDLSTARLLTEAAIVDMDEPDLKLVIADLRRSKPFLFRSRRSSNNSNNNSSDSANTSPTPRAVAQGLRITPPPLQAQQAAQQAIATGSRRDVLRYLRLRRGS
jgi:hypothetical protein